MPDPTFRATLIEMGSPSATFDGYLIAGKIEAAIGVYEAAENMEQLAHFCTLRARHDPQTLHDLERTVFATAEQRAMPPLVPSTTDQVPPGFSGDRRASSILRRFQSAPSPA